MKQWIKDANNEFLADVRKLPQMLIEDDSIFLLISVILAVAELVAGAVFCSIVLGINDGISTPICCIMVSLIVVQYFYMEKLRQHWLNYKGKS